MRVHDRLGAPMPVKDRAAEALSAIREVFGPGRLFQESGKGQVFDEKRLREFIAA
jgi:hypothetical protein